MAKDIINKTKQREEELHRIDSEDLVYETEDMIASFTDMRKAIKEGKITKQGLQDMADDYGIDIQLLLDFADMDRLEQEQDIRFKSDLSNVENTFCPYPMIEGETKEFAGVKLTGNKDGTVHCESDYLGTFDYDPAQWGVATKVVKDDDGNNVEVPVFVYEGFGDGNGVDAENIAANAVGNLGEIASDQWDKGHYIRSGLAWVGAGLATFDAILIDDINYALTRGDGKFGGQIKVPDGVKNLDYTFANRDDLEYFPEIPESVESMHCTFENCTNMTVQQVFHSSQYINLPSNLKDMSCTFKNCKSLQGVFLGSDVQVIPEYIEETGTYGYNDEEYAKIEDWEKHMEESWAETHNGEAFDWNAYYNEHVSTGWCHIPSGVENVMECWSGCESLDAPTKEGPVWYSFFGIGGKTAFNNNKKSDKSYELPIYGGRITPYLDAAFAKDALAGISGKSDAEFVKQYADSMEYTMKYGVINDKYKDLVDSLDQEKVNKAKASALMYRQGSNHRGDISTMAELASGNSRSDNTIWDKDENGNYYLHNDATGLKNSMHEVNSKDVWGGWINMAISGLAIGGITGKATNNKWAGIAAGVGGTLALSSVFPKLYESFLPVLEFTHDLLPEGSAAQKKLRGFIDERSPNALINRQNEAIAGHNELWNDPYNVATAFLSGKDPNGEALTYTGGLKYTEDGETKTANGGKYTSGGTKSNMINPLTDIFSRTTEMAPYWGGDELDTLMTNSGQACATSQIFLALGTYRDPDTNEFKNLTSPVTESIREACSAREQTWMENDSNVNKQSMKDYYYNLMHALETYNKEGIDALQDMYTPNGTEYNLAKQGLIDVNKAYVAEVVSSIKKMDMKYHFMSENDWDVIKNMNIEGTDLSLIDKYKVSYTDVPTIDRDRQLFWDVRDGKINKLPEQETASDDEIQDDISSDEETSANEDLVEDDLAEMVERINVGDGVSISNVSRDDWINLDDFSDQENYDEISL